MLQYPQIDPVAIHLGPLAVHWYGLMYLLAFVGCWSLLSLRARNPARGVSVEQVADMIFYGALGVIIGGRVGYMLFYATSDLVEHPLEIFQVWKGGMSFHGGMLGVIIALGFYARKIHKNVIDLADFVAPAIPFGLGVGRIGNFINGELWGRVTDVPWAMVFPSGGPLPRHPSQLYEVFLEGIVMFIILWIYSMKRRPRWAVSGLFLVLYGTFRFIIEFFREPDPQIGYLAFGWLTEGQVLSFPMVVIGLIMVTYAYWSKKPCSNTWNF